MKAQMWNKRFWVKETNPVTLQKVYNQIILDAGFGICQFTEHYFEPQGYTGIWLLSESHLAIHTFPEENKTYIELTSCVKKQFDQFSKLVGLNKKNL